MQRINVFSGDRDVVLTTKKVQQRELCYRRLSNNLQRIFIYDPIFNFVRYTVYRITGTHGAGSKCNLKERGIESLIYNFDSQMSIVDFTLEVQGDEARGYWLQYARERIHACRHVWHVLIRVGKTRCVRVVGCWCGYNQCLEPLRPPTRPQTPDCPTGMCPLLFSRFLSWKKFRDGRRCLGERVYTVAQVRGRRGVQA